MNSAAVQAKLDLAAYLEWESGQPDKNEFVRGEVFAMVGPQRVHGEIVRNLTVALHAHLKDTPCRSYSAGMKVRVATADAVFYPDLFVTCDARDLATDRVFEHPKLVIEVFPDSTGAYERGLKFAAYRQLPSLAEYALIAPERKSVEVFRRNADGLFVLHDFTGQEAVEFQSIGAKVPLATLFENV